MWYERLQFKGLSDNLLARMKQAQEELDWIERASADDLLGIACVQLGLEPSLTLGLSKRERAIDFGDRPHAELLSLFTPLFPSGTTLASDLADQVQLARAFADPASVVARLETKVAETARRFPRTAADLKVGENRGDVLDPFILAANFEMLSGRDVARTIETALTHKVLMKMEDLVGNLHQGVLGAMRGNFLIPEPQRGPGLSKDVVLPAFNPFPGADLGQVPTPAAPDAIRLFQIKNKTGSAKGGDGKRLGTQLRLLTETYGAQTFYVSIVGNTLRGHRSKGAVLRESPRTAVLVGDAAVDEVARSRSGAELLLRTYRRAFRAVANASPYEVPAVLAAVLPEFQRGTSPLSDAVDAWLQYAMGGPRPEQDSRLGKT